jgi:hypothetical protein
MARNWIPKGMEANFRRNAVAPDLEMDEDPLTLDTDFCYKMCLIFIDIFRC